MQSIDSIETYAYGTSKEIICNNITKQYKKDQLWWSYKREKRI